MDRWLTELRFDVVVCPALINELSKVLARDRFRRWISLEDARLFIERLASEAEAIPDPEDIPPVTTDPKDDYLVALYLSSGADV